jgi:starch-binding outer membrane protein, SusD/RagB family
MKKYLLFIALPLALVLMSGCVKLKEVPPATLAPSNFYKTEADFNAAVTGLFPLLYGSYGPFDWAGVVVLAAGADDVALAVWDDNYLRCDNLTLTSTNGFIDDGAWQRLYATINNANSLIKNLGNGTGIPQVKLDEFEGQARFIRAFCYFYTTRFWGKIPIVPENTVKPEDLVESPVLDIYKFIIEDLKIAEVKLAVSYPEKGKATMGAAKTLLAQVYLTMAGWPIKDASFYALARDKAKEVMNMNVYQLEPNFADLWLVANKLTNREMIFTFFGSSRFNYVQGSHYHVETRPGVENGWEGVFSEVPFFNSFPAGPRKDATFWTVFTDGSTWQNNPSGAPYIAKFRDAGAAATQTGDALTFDGDGFNAPLRYADVLLMYAEAANMAEGSPSAAALSAINAVRVRAGLAPLASGMSQAAFDKAVFDERGWELAFECGSRWFDLIRKEKLVEIIGPQYPYVDAHNMLLPKPAKELTLVKGLTQNPGYQ